jgi:hypothetical protein
VLTEEAVRCVKTLKIYIGKMENGQKTFSKWSQIFCAKSNAN